MRGYEFWTFQPPAHVLLRQSEVTQCVAVRAVLVALILLQPFRRLGLESRVGVVRNCRGVQKSDMVLNDWQPTIEVDPQTYQVRADGELLICEPAELLPMAQRYFLF